MARKKPADYYTLAGKRGFRWLGPEVTNTTVKTTWECEQGHRWQARYSAIQQGQGCRVCADDAARKIPADYHALARERGFRWPGPEVANTRTGTTWECKRGHRWQARYNTLQKGAGCPVCAGNAPKTPADYRALAQARGFRWLGPKAANARTKTGWQCAEGHRWMARYSNFRQGSGCPVCARAGRVEAKAK